jgi:cell division cycle 14
MNWLVPGKLLAFASPYQTSTAHGFRVCRPTDLLRTFSELGITIIVRLNHATYDETAFTRAGIRHIELPFPDGTCPPQAVVTRFLKIADTQPVVAVHCKAGLGRT